MTAVQALVAVFGLAACGVVLAFMLNSLWWLIFLLPLLILHEGGLVLMVLIVVIVSMLL